MKEFMHNLSQISWPSFALGFLLLYLVWNIWSHTVIQFLYASRDSLRNIHTKEVERLDATLPGSPERYEVTMSNWFFYTRPVMKKRGRYLLVFLLFVFSWSSLFTMVLVVGEALRNVGP